MRIYYDLIKVFFYFFPYVSKIGRAKCYGSQSAAKNAGICQQNILDKRFMYFFYSNKNASLILV